MSLFTGWDAIAKQLRLECAQAAYEGKRVPDELEREIARLPETADLFDDPRARELAAALAGLEPADDFPYEQPGELAAIRALRPEGPRRLPVDDSGDALLDKFHGAWTGRSCGCALGKPVEGWAMIHRGRLRIRAYLERRGEWPLADYFPAAPHADDEHPIGAADPAARENLACMPPDDDIHYTLMGLHVLETHGAGFDWTHVARAWNERLPFASICTAERQAITNFNLRNVPGPEGATPSPFWTARHNNPYREWIGAQIRADGWAYAAAGHPERAAELAWRDAHWTHTANGIYGEMFMAAMISAAFVVAEPAELVRIGLSEIPSTCRLAEAVRSAWEWTRACGDFDAYMERLEAAYGDLHPTHTVNNALVCVGALVYGAMEPSRSMCLAVMGGLDTDCNGATVGSIVGAATGARAFPERFKGPLRDTIRPTMIGFSEVTMRDLAARTRDVWRGSAEPANSGA